MRQTGRTTRLIESLPDIDDIDGKIYVIASSTTQSSYIRSLIADIKGTEYAKKVEANGASGISTWGRGIWSDKFYFDHTVFDYFDSLQPEDQDFIRLITSSAPISKTLQLSPAEELQEEASDITFKQRVLGFFRGIFRVKS